MKRTLKRLLCGFLVMLMCVTMLPVNAFAWSYMSHMNSANILRMEMMSYDSQYLNLEIDVPGYGEFKYTIPEEFYAAIFKYPDAFRAGSLGPDFYPDLVIGQMYIHPYDSEARVGSGDWLDLLVESVNRMPQGSENRLRALSFTLGFMLHYCGDMFGHDFINTFSGGTFPSIMDVNITDTKDPELNNILSHMSMENYMDDLVNKEFYEDSKQIEIDAPDRFVADTLLLDSSIPSGAAEIFDEFGEAVVYIQKMLEYRNDIMGFADELRTLTEPICMLLSSYADRWALDIDAAIYGLVDAFDRIAHRLVTGDPNPEIHEETLKEWAESGYPLKEMLKDMWDLQDTSGDVGIILEELSFWLDEYGWKALGIPDWMIDPPIPDWLEEFWDALTFPINVVLARVKEMLCGLFAAMLDWIVGDFVEGVRDEIAKYDDRLDYPSIQLDHPDNPYRPSGTNNFEEFDVYMDRYAAEQELLEDYDLISLLTNSDGKDVLEQLTDSEFEAFYNTMMMFKLILMGPDNFTRFLEHFGIKNQQAYQTNIGEIEATVLKLDVKTMDQQWAGTDDNVWAVVKKRSTGEEVKRKLLDNSFVNDLECGDTNTFYIELPDPMKLTDIELYLEQHDTMTTDGGWDCESVTVTPMHAGYNVFFPIGLGGNPEMDAGVTWDLQFHTALIFRTNGLKVSPNTPVTHVAVRIKTGDGSYASGTDQDVKISAFDRNETEPIPENMDYWVQLDLDKYLYDDFEDGDDDIYIVPLGDFDPATGKNKYPTLGNLELIIKHNSDYDWYINNVTVTPYYGNWPLTDEMDFGSHNVHHINYNVKLSPYQKIEDGSIVYKTYDGVSLTYETPLDDGLLKDMKSLDAGVQWENLHVLWNSPEGRSLFFKLFKGFGPEIAIDAPDSVTEGDDYDINLNFTGMWNGVSADRRNEVSGIQDMPAVNGTVDIHFTNVQTNEVRNIWDVPVENNTAVISSDEPAIKGVAGEYEGMKGIYHIKVEYTPDSEDPWYGKSEALFRNALVVKEDNRYAATVSAICEGAPVTSKLLADLNEYGTVTGSGIYEIKEHFTITATPNTGYKFKEWIINGVHRGSDIPAIHEMMMPNRDMDYVTVFEPETYTITIATNDDLGLAGTIEGAGTYKYGERGTITATPNDNFVFTGWYLDGHLLSTKQSLNFTAVRDAKFTATFANAATVNIGDKYCGYSIYVDDANSEALDSLANSGKISREDLAALISDKAGKSFEVAKDSTVTFKVEIKEGYEKTDTFKVSIPVKIGNMTSHLALTPDENGKYTIEADADKTISISGVRKIEPTSTPVIDYMEFEDGSITFQAYVPDEEGEVTIWLYVNNNQIESVDEIVEYTLSKKNLDRHGGIFSVSAVAQAEGKLISETATLTNNSLGTDVVVPVEIEDTENGTVEMDAGAKYDAPGTQTKLTVTPDGGYVLHKLIVTYDVDGEEVEVEVTDEGIVESEAEEVIIGTEKVEIDGEEYEYFTRTSDDVEIVKEDGVYYFTRPAGKATVKALFKPENAVLGDVNLDGEVTVTDATALLRHVARIETITDAQALANAEVTNDNELTVTDATKILRYVARIINSLED